MKAIYKFSIAVTLVLQALAAQANDVLIAEVPTNWRMQNYAGGTVVLWYTGSTCGGGQLVFQPGVPAEDRNRLWSTVMTAVVSSKKVFVYYDNASQPGACFINSFGLDGNL